MYVNKPLLALVGGLLTGQAHAAMDNDALLREVRRLAERVGQLEAANRQLQVALSRGGQPGEARQAMAERLEELENEVLAMQRKPSALERLADISAAAALTLVAQRPAGTAGGDSGQLTARADVEVEIPLAAIGDGESKLFAHFRAGDGDGIDAAVGAFAPANAMAFGNTPQPVLMQAWYQLDMPVGAAGGELGRVEFTLGKIDPFGFFDGNNVADDESEQFLNLAFIHNPLLDAGGDITPGDHGASPGFRLAYVSDVNGGNHLTAALGVFAAGGDGAGGGGSNYLDSFERPLLIGQLEYAGKTFAGRPGAYRLYAWNNGRAFDLAGTPEQHGGWGLSIDQEVASHVSLFSRVGLSTQGNVNFDSAYTFGAQFTGTAWGREHDRLGIALGWLNASAEYRQANPGFTSAEQPCELYYAWQVNENLQLSPSVQWIGHPAGKPAADAVTVLSLRAKAAF